MHKKMKLIRTVKLKLENVNPDDLLSTFRAYTKAYNYICEIGFKDRNFNKIELHHKTYDYCRTQFGLKSELAVQVRDQAAESIKSVTKLERKKHKKFKCPKSKQTSIRLCKGSFNIWFDRHEVSVLTLNGRIRCKVNLPDCFQQYFSWRRKGATLSLKKDKLFLHIVFEKEIEDVQCSNDNVLGIDRGIVNIATLSDGTVYSGEHVLQVKQRYQAIRSKLQSKSSRSARRHLRTLSARENRFVTDVNHCISKDIVSRCNPETVLVLEKLKDIRDRSGKLRKTERAKVNSWSFYQLEQFLTYKALAKGCSVQYVDARYTSQKCSVCGYTVKGNRTTQSHFKCKKCGFECNADLNAAINIANNFRASVNKPIVAGSNT